MKLLGCDVGTTHCKAGLFELDGTVCAIAARPMPVRRSADRAAFDPEETWQVAAAVVREAAAAAGDEPIGAIGIASMAETGLLVDRRTGQPKSALVPWLDRGALPQAERLRQGTDPGELFRRTGQRASYKAGLAKLLWLEAQEPGVAAGAVWLSTADFVAHRLTGAWVTDPTLAARTLAYRLDAGGWDAERLSDFDLAPDLFPAVLPSGANLGQVTRRAAAETGLPAGAPVAVCGHDHVVAALAVGATEPGGMLDSLGTAESLLGALPARPLTRDDFATGLSFGPHVAPGRMYWMAGLSASGGSLDWLRGVLADPPLSYEATAALLAACDPAPADLLYLPYLLGAQAPRPDPAARGAFVGLTAAHTRGDLLKAILQGTAYEMACAQEVAERATGAALRSAVAVGGGARVPGWLQIKADVTGQPLHVSAQSEATLLGAAVLAGIGAGVYAGAGATNAFSAARAAIARPPAATYWPDAARHGVHRKLLAIYLALQEPIRQASAALASQRKAVAP